MENDAEIPDSGYLTGKVVNVTAGEAHTLALSGDGCVYSWGRGTFGRLGTGTEEDQHFPVKVRFRNSKLKFVAVAAGAYHSLALADDGSVWSWGYNVCAIKAGGMLSLAIDDHGALWMWGNCPQKSNSSSNEEDVLSFVSSFTPTPVWSFYGHTVFKVACGNEHVIALVSAGETYEGNNNLICYSWGKNTHGQLGLGDNESRLHPEIVETFNQDSPWAVYDIACGAFHTALLTTKKRPCDSDATALDESTSVCWTFGLGENGQLGHGMNKSLLVPEIVEDLLSLSVYLVSVDCGLFHTSVVSLDGEVWSWGMKKGLGLCPDAGGDAVSPLLVGSKFQDPVQVSCGAAHTVLVASNGLKLWSWGRGRSGVLGNGKTVDCFVPTVVLWPPPPLVNDFFKQKDLESSSETMKFATMERYASVLHGLIFGEPFEAERDIPDSLRDDSRAFDVAREWESMVETADSSKLLTLESFYRSMLARVKDKLMKRRIQKLIKECFDSEKHS